MSDDNQWEEFLTVYGESVSKAGLSRYIMKQVEEAPVVSAVSSLTDVKELNTQGLKFVFLESERVLLFYENSSVVEIFTEESKVRMLNYRNILLFEKVYEYHQSFLLISEIILKDDSNKKIVIKKSREVYEDNLKRLVEFL